MANSTKSATLRKPKKPADSPIFPHASGRWAKKINGQFAYFGSWKQGVSHKEALNTYHEQKDDLFAGRRPRAAGSRLTCEDACCLYLDDIELRIKRGERSERLYTDTQRTLSIFLEAVGKHWAIESLRSEDFAQVRERLSTTTSDGSRRSPITIRNDIVRVRTLFNWLYRAELIEHPPQYGTAFDSPDQTVIDRHTDAKVDKYFSRKQIRALLRVTKTADPQLHAAILLAINTGCQNIDCETLQLKHLDLQKGWYLQPRSKKAKKRRMKLWARTVQALKPFVSGLGPDDLVFSNQRFGGIWHSRNCICKEFAVAKEAAGITTAGAGFQWLRHSFITEASQTGDLLAVQLACGHAPRLITQNYIRDKYDKRLIKIAEHVESWLCDRRAAK